MNDVEDKDGQQSAEQPRWVMAAKLDELTSAGALEVVLEGHIIALFEDEGVIRALDGLCAHQGGPIAKGERSETHDGHSCVTCPWHGWQYELQTGIQTVNRQPLQRVFPVKVEDGSVLVGV